MPEGHTIHRLALDIQRDLGAQTLRISSPQGRFAAAGMLDGETLVEAEAIGKHLLLHLQTTCIHIHLGLFGKFYRVTAPAPAPRPSVRLRLSGDTRTWDLVGPTACVCLETSELAALRERIGADPLSARARPQKAWKTFSTSRRAVGALLLDQSIIAGIGNVYRAEILFLLGIHPEVPANRIGQPQFKKLWALAQQLLARGVKEGRIVTTPKIKGVRSTRRESLYVYKRAECRTCEGAITSVVLAGRPIYLCATCQPLDSSYLPSRNQFATDNTSTARST